MTSTSDNHLRPDDTAVLDALPFEPPEQDRDDSLAAELARAAPRRWWNRGTLVLGALALVVAGFLGGVQVQKHYGTAAAATSAAGARAGGFGGTGRGAGANQQPGGGAFPGGAAPTATATAATTGTVKLVDGDTVYVQTANGDVVTVKTTGGTTVQTARAATLKDVQAGDAVTVQGTAGSDGTVAATSVTAGKKK